MAAHLGIPVAQKPDSQSICFVKNETYAALINRLCDKHYEEGDILNTEGVVLGKHSGYVNYTIGQRRGLGLSNTEPLYVLSIDAQNNTVTIGPKEHLLKRELYIDNINWLANIPVSTQAIVKIRSSHPGVLADIDFLSYDCAKVTLSQAEYAIAPGQACVAYDNDRLLGGGFITM
jgi:tRNA-specific 2-thiouridylase